MPPIFDILATGDGPAAPARRLDPIQSLVRRLTAINREALSTFRGGIQTRIDTPWSRGLLPGGFTPMGESLNEMRWRAQSLDDNNTLAAGVLDRTTENVIGSGIQIYADTSDPLFNLQADAWWEFLTTGKRFDVRRRFTWSKFQRMFFRKMFRDGDAGVVLVDVAGMPRLQLIDGGDISTPSGKGIRDRIVDGLELNGVGAAVRYWVQAYDLASGRITHEPVDERDMIFMALGDRLRGLPVFNGSYTLFDQIVGFLEAVVQASRIHASQAMIAKRRNPDQAWDSETESETDSTGATQRVMPIEGGAVNIVDIDEDLVAFNPTQPQVQLPDAMRTFARFLGLKPGLTVERVLLDFSKANYSVSKSTDIQEGRTAGVFQDEFYHSFFARVWPWAISKGVKLGVIRQKAPPDAWKAEWIPPARPSPDRLKDITADTAAVALGVEAPSNIAAANGYRLVKLAQRIKRDRELLAAAGVSLPSIADGVKLAAAAATGTNEKTDQQDLETDDADSE